MPVRLNSFRGCMREPSRSGMSPTECIGPPGAPVASALDWITWSVVLVMLASVEDGVALVSWRTLTPNSQCPASCAPFVDQEDMEKERKAIEEEMKRQKRLDKEREVEQRRKKEQEKEVAWLDQKEVTRKLKEEASKQMKLLEIEGRQQAVKVLILRPLSTCESWLLFV